MLVVAPLTEGRFLAQQTVDAGAHLLELSKARLREVESYVDSGFLSRGVAAVSSRILDDGWTREVLGRVPWGLIVVEGDSVSSAEIDVLASLIAETRASALVLADAPTVERRFETFGDLVVTAWLTDQYQSDEPPADLSSRFRLRPFTRDESEWALPERVQDVLRDVGSLASPLGLSSLEAAAASSHFALQTKALRSLERLRSRNIAAQRAIRTRPCGRASGRPRDTSLSRHEGI